MREFFRGWRRKIGLVTLVMAVALLGLWSISIDRFCYLQFPMLGYEFAFASLNGQVAWATRENPDGHFHCRTGTNSQYDVATHLELCTLYESGWGSDAQLIDYSPFTLPLAFLSASLLLVPSRKRLPTSGQPHA
ncbi:MAG TPA: hypothetical protein VGM98_00550 [Schlesneria sp.]